MLGCVEFIHNCHKSIKPGYIGSAATPPPVLTLQQQAAADKLKEMRYYHKIETALYRVTQVMQNDSSKYSKSEISDIKKNLEDARGKLTVLDKCLTKYRDHAESIGVDPAAINHDSMGDPFNVFPVAGDLTMQIGDAKDYLGVDPKAKSNTTIEVRIDNSVPILKAKAKRTDPSSYTPQSSHKINLGKRLWFYLYEKETLIGFATYELESLLESNMAEEELTIEPAGTLTVKLGLMKNTDRYAGGLQRVAGIKQARGGKTTSSAACTGGHTFLHLPPDVEPTNCIVCTKITTTRSYQCRGCKVVAHRGCYSSSSVPRCQSEDTGSDEPINTEDKTGHNIPHRFTQLKGLSKATCYQCKAINIGILGQSLQCSDCSIVCCKKCKDAVANHCGVPEEYVHYMSRQSDKSQAERKSLKAKATPSASTATLEPSSDPPPCTPTAEEQKPRPPVPQPYEKKVLKPVQDTEPVAVTVPEMIATGVSEISAVSRLQMSDFTFISVLGRGNFGKVMLAEDSKTNTLCAIKLIKKHYTVQQDEVESIRTEKEIFQVANQERHPFLVNLYSCFQTPTHLCFVMEYACGGDLMKHIHNEVFGSARGRFYACEILLGLEYLHTNGIVYRDLKLDNLLLDREGHIKIADFGLCKTGMFHNQTTQTFCGTPEFIAPEILKEASYTRAVDWWAFGILIFEMIVGQAPFFGANEDEIFDQIMYNELHIPTWLGRKNPAAVSIIKQLVVKNPKDRLGSSVRDAEEIKEHPWFSDVKWTDVYHKRIPVPRVPRLLDPRDTSNFDDEFTAEEAIVTPIQESPLDAAEQAEFDGFSLHTGWLAGNV
ncbi:AGC protein kinase [Sphaeroforma arctica JP610]|uniref:protein kinase C n=1 Tax=Sphaeroforma arctica JP610 TaxID=667725 RepID=A0A0L0FZV9_9EUKA|nr:AGC protein kinase [Sphaeroforma arctica JP610]KNC82134.1 AGC protein kinase [Sphaeroforma arctica JP610]|eukprot:XP_014156036.1 AGC protein kinase [Sphaeroforma arctica JP610]